MRLRTLLLSSIALIGLAAASPAFADDYDCPNIDRAVDIYNESSTTFHYIDAANRDSVGADASDNLINDVLEPGGSVTVYLNDGTGYHVFNLEAYDEDNGTIAMTQLDACSTSAEWIITDDDVEPQDLD